VLLEQTGTLAEGDASFNDGSLYDEYFFQGEAGQIVKITLESDEFDTYLLLESPAGERIATNDDSGDGTNAQIVVQLLESGQYRVLVNALDETGRGNYRLLAEQGTLVELQQAELLTEAEAVYREARSLYNQSQFRDALGKYERALELYRDIGDQAVEIRILNSLGDTSWWLGDFPQALSYAEASLNLSRELGNASGEAEALRDIGDVYDSLGDYQEALEVYEQSLTITRELGDRAGEANTLNNIGIVYRQLGKYPEAIAQYEASLVITRELGDRAGEAQTLNNIGIVYRLLGKYPEAIAQYEASLAITREIGDRATEAKTLNNIGIVYESLGKYPEAIDYYAQSLVIKREIGDRAGEAATLNNIGIVYRLLGNYPEAIAQYEASLAITREIGDRAGEAATFNNIGVVYRQLGNYPEAIAQYEASLAITREIGDREGETQTLGNLGNVYRALGNYSVALNYHLQSLALERELGDRNGEAQDLNNIGIVYQSLRNYPEAIDYYEQSLVITREIGDRAGEALTFGNIGDVYQAQGQPELAIVFLKDAINTYETIRTDNRALDQELQDSYTETVVGRYRTLTDLLLEQGRILEAQQVLELLKVEELRAFTRANYAGGTLTYDPAEQPVVAAHGSLIALGAALAQCDPNCDQTLYDQQIALERQYDQTVASFEQTVRQGRASDSVFYDPASLSSDALDLVNAQPGTVLIYPVVLEDRLWLLWTATGGVVGSVEVPVTQAELSRAALQFRELLERQDAQAYDEFRAVSQQLYGWLIAPMAPELEKNAISHLIFAQDRTTRYLPMAALYDGSQYLLENYTVSTVLSAALTDTQGRLGHVDSASALGLGLTQAVPGFSPLPNVAEELRAMIRSADNADGGIYPGQIFLDEAFTFEALSQNVRRANILHIATHAEFVPSTQGESYILSGTGQRMALADIGALDTQFRNLHLVVLSACQTALGGATLDGTEIAGLSSYFLGRNKAKTVMATLWKVDDAGTSLLMQRFYTLLATGELTTAEALRQAQLSLLLGETNLDSRLTSLGVNRGGFTPAIINSKVVRMYYPWSQAWNRRA
jgi:CHAT domain-containing protein/Flp pilus assembly protein TadD